MNEEPSPASDAEAEPSVFGNLPRTRPGVRSPRRDAAATARSARKAATAKAGAKQRQPDPHPPPPPEDAPEGTSSAEEDGGGIEELAWAGVAAAAEAATLGVRLANRALGSLRGGSERS